MRLPPFLQDAYELAEEFCRLLARRVPAGYFRMLLLRRIGSTIAAGRCTVEKLLSEWEDIDEDEDDEETLDHLRTLTGAGRAVLERLLKAIDANRERDPKYEAVRRQLVEEGFRGGGIL